VSTAADLRFSVERSDENRTRALSLGMSAAVASD
jgi:hypothetical protein